MTPTDAAEDLARTIGDATGRYERALARIIQQAQGRVMVDLAQQFRLTPDRRIRLTAANIRLIESLNDRFMGYMRDAGFDSLNEAFTGQFPGLTGNFFDVFEAINQATANRLPAISFSSEDLAAFSGLQRGARLSLESIARIGAGRARDNAMLMIGGADMRDMTSFLTRELSLIPSQAVTYAETSMATYYRRVTSRAYETVERDLPQVQLRYRYYGPLDKLTRPFCRRMMRANRNFSRDEIDAMSNGTKLSAVFEHCGGWGCRHQWILDAQNLMRRLRIAA